MDRSQYNNVQKCGSPLLFLTQEEMEQIHSSTLQILQEVGSDIQHKPAREMLEKAGCSVKGKRVFIPGGLVEWATRQAPSHIHVYDRDGDPAMDLGGRNAYYGTGSDCPTILDVNTGEHRSFTYKDMEDGAKIIDALPQLDFLMCCGLLYDFPSTSYEHQYAIMLRNSTKPQVVTAASRESISNITKMAIAVRGSLDELAKKPLFIMYNEPTSPLNHTFEAVDKLIYCAENQLPTNYSPCMMTGATGPITNAGGLVQANAECLAGLVIHQLARPGSPIVFGGAMYNMDLKCMQPTYCSPESIVNNIALAQIGRDLYHVPTWGFTGCSGGKVFDAQAMNESAQYIFAVGFAGVNLNHDVGFMNYGLTFSYEMLVASNETISQMRRVFDGVVLDRDHLALDIIKSVGPKGHYLSEEHTLKYNAEMWLPDLTDRGDLEQWQRAGGTTFEQRVKARTIDIIENYTPKPLTPEQDAEISEILKQADSAAEKK
ncbi:MAG: trimethylamine methyltransferase family protein [Synergistaceae bacterium]|jgi:trimethylamine--corrinoid protein Co-methyltransferase|nr:trimethylamine methyltransferase family protein [Synergistaceae bacterium]